MSNELIPCPGCGASFPPFDGPTHRYIGASAACWALMLAWMSGNPPEAGLLAGSIAPRVTPASLSQKDAGLLDAVWGDAYGVQHHGDDSPQAIQSVAIHLLALHGAVTQRADGMWVKRRALRKRGVFHKLAPPALGCALTIRHLFSGEGPEAVITKIDYAYSVYNAWLALHRTTVERWYELYVAGD
ncbi:MAG: DUF5946 family protein [Bryobacteraceae bacterium]